MQVSRSCSSRPKRWHEWFGVDFVGVFLVFFLYAGSRVPEVNEVHYWTKAAHFWDPNFATGDLFLSSGNAHWAFYFFFGSLTLWLPLDTAVWVGRFITWIAIALGWTALCHGIFTQCDKNASQSPESEGTIRLPISQSIPSTMLAALWLVGMEWGLWAGEWVVGGCESKGLAYAFLFGGLAALSRSKPLLGWLLLGLGNWFHVISGLWVSATAVCALVIIEIAWNKRSIGHLMRMHVPGLLLCGIGFVAGAAPAVIMDLDTPRDQATMSAMEQVYNRLGHHLSPIKFNEIRWRGFTILVITAFSLHLIARGAWWSRDAGWNHGKDQNLVAGTTSNWIRTAPNPFQFLLVVCMAAFGFAMFGLVFDLIFSHLAPKLASSILRFYWFRWNDVTLPLYAALIAFATLTGELRLRSQSESNTRKILGAIGLVLVISLFVTRYQRNTETDIPAGEKQSFSLKSDSLETRLREYDDWKAVCRWINNNTDETSLWLTPRRQQSFKWQTRRPELAVWKDMPQNARSVVEWSARLNDAYKFDKLKQLQPMSISELERLVNKYQIRYVLLDLRVKGQPIPKDKQIYPTDEETNDSFAVLRYESTTLEASP
jgi:hypothetical protein